MGELLPALPQVTVLHLLLRDSAFGTVTLDAAQGLGCIGTCSPVLWLGEGRKMVHHAWVGHARRWMAAPRPPSA